MHYNISYCKRFLFSQEPSRLKRSKKRSTPKFSLRKIKLPRSLQSSFPTNAQLFSIPSRRLRISSLSTRMTTFHSNAPSSYLFIRYWMRSSSFSLSNIKDLYILHDHRVSTTLTFLSSHAIRARVVSDPSLSISLL